MKKHVLFIYFIFIVFCLNAQSICTLDVKIKNMHDKPLPNKNLYLYSGKTKLSWSYTDEKGEASFLIDSLPLNSDSVYFYIKTEDSLSSNIEIFINKLSLLENNEIGKYSIKITDFKLFTQEEFSAYCEKNGLMPPRKTTLAKDVK